MAHVSNTRHIPRADVLVELGVGGKHTAHARYVTGDNAAGVQRVRLSACSAHHVLDLLCGVFHRGHHSIQVGQVLWDVVPLLI